MEASVIFTEKFYMAQDLGELKKKNHLDLKVIRRKMINGQYASMYKVFDDIKSMFKVFHAAMIDNQ